MKFYNALIDRYTVWRARFQCEKGPHLCLYLYRACSSTSNILVALYENRNCSLLLHSYIFFWLVWTHIPCSCVSLRAVFIFFLSINSSMICNCNLMIGLSIRHWGPIPRHLEANHQNPIWLSNPLLIQSINLLSTTYNKAFGRATLGHTTITQESSFHAQDFNLTIIHWQLRIKP